MRLIPTKSEFFSLKTSWNRVPGMIYWVGLILVAASFLAPDDWHLATIGVILYVPWMIKSFFDFRRMHKSYQWDKVEWLVRSIIRENKVEELKRDKNSKIAEKDWDKLIDAEHKLQEAIKGF